VDSLLFMHLLKKLVEMKICCISLLLLFGGQLFSQQITISGKLVNSDGHPVNNARYYLKSKQNQVKRTDDKGNFEIIYTTGITDSIRFEHVSYQRKSVAITKKMVKRAVNDTIYIKVVLDDIVLKVYDVFANTPDTLFGTQEYNIADYEFDTSGNLILLTYFRNKSAGCVLRLVSPDLKVLDHFVIPEKSVELQRDFRGNIHLINEESVLFITVVNEQFELFLEDRDYYFRYVAPIVDTISNFIYFSNYSEIYPAFEYFEFNRKDSAYKKLLSVEDRLMMEFYLAEFKYVDVRTKIWAHQKQLETGIDKEIWVGATVFTNSIYYKPLYAPLFKLGTDSILVFDHYSNQLFFYQPEAGIVDSIAITYHKEAKKSGWEQPLIQDRETGKIYALFVRAGYSYLHEIDIETGTIKQSFKLHFRYIENIQISGGNVYYIYRPFESIQKKYIYSEKLIVTL